MGLRAPMDRLLTTADLAALLGTTPNGVYMRLKRHSPSIPAPLRMPDCSSLCWRQSDVEAWLAALPTRVVAKPRPRRYKDKAPALTGEAAIWEKYKGL